MSAFETKIQQTLTDVNIPFGSSDARYCMSETRTDYDAGPGDTHQDTDKMFGALGRQADRQAGCGAVFVVFAQAHFIGLDQTHAHARLDRR